MSETGMLNIVKSDKSILDFYLYREHSCFWIIHFVDILKKTLMLVNLEIELFTRSINVPAIYHSRVAHTFLNGTCKTKFPSPIQHYISQVDNPQKPINYGFKYTNR